MSWIVVAAVFVAGTLATFTDWYFMGVLYHDRYAIYPETWWPAQGRNTNRILYSSALGYVTAAAVVALCAMAGVDSVWSGIKVAAIAWLSGSFVQVVTTHIWVRIDLRVTIAHAIGYLARFLIAGIAAGIALPHL
jgi:hypothetical protein